MNLKLNTVVAAALTVLSLGASAGGSINNDDPVTLPSSWSVNGGMGGVGTFDDTWTFTTAASSYASGSASSTSVFVAALNSWLFQVTNFSAAVDGNPLSLVSSSIQNFGDNLVVTKTIFQTPVLLAPGFHTFTISGTTGASGGGYTATLSLTPAVPEPETYAMMLAGLAAVGFLARRRQS